MSTEKGRKGDEDGKDMQDDKKDRKKKDKDEEGRLWRQGQGDPSKMGNVTRQELDEWTR